MTVASRVKHSLNVQTLKKRLVEMNNDQKVMLGILCAQCGDDIGYGVKGYKVICATCARDNNEEWGARNEEEYVDVE